MINVTNFKETFTKIEKLYYLYNDEMTNFDFINFIIILQKHHENEKEIWEFLERRLQEKKKILEKIRILKEDTEKSIKNVDNKKLISLFLTLFLQSKLYKNKNNGNKRIREDEKIGGKKT